jgi:hypothetical protein
VRIRARVAAVPRPLVVTTPRRAAAADAAHITKAAERAVLVVVTQRSLKEKM